MEHLTKIPVEDLPTLRDLYKAEHPLHVSTFSTIQLFIERFEKHPEWVEKVCFLSLNDDWRKTGTFVMTNSSRVFFNTLEMHPFNHLRQALLLMEFNDKITFVNIRDALRPLVLDIIRIHHFEIASDIGTRSFLMPREPLLEAKIM